MSPIISLISSAYPWPEAWIGVSRAVTTVQPMRNSRSIVSLIARSLPGIGVALKTTVSPSCSSTAGWSLWAIRRSAEPGSPCDPVDMITSFSSGKSSISRGAIMIPSGMSASPSERAMFWYFFIERPTSATLRPSCGGRVDDLLHAVHVRRERRDDHAPGRALDDLGQVRPDAGLATATSPARSAFVESPHSSSSPSCAELAPGARSPGRSDADRRLVELVVAGDEHGAELARQRDARGVRDRVRHVDELDRERPGVDQLARLDVDEVDVAQLVLVQPRARHRHRELAPVDRRRVVRARARAGPTAARRRGPRGACVMTIASMSSTRSRR